MRQGGKRSNLFLVELILDLFLFALCAAVCVGLLVHARGMSRQSTDLTRAVYAAQAAAEDWKATGALPDGTPGADGLTASASEQGGALDITITRDGREIYVLEGVRRVE